MLVIVADRRDADAVGRCPQGPRKAEKKRGPPRPPSPGSPNSCPGHQARITQGRASGEHAGAGGLPAGGEAGAMFVGIDVAKAHLDLAVRPSGEQWRVPNDEAGIGQVLARVQALQPTLVVLEATGGLEVPLAAALAAAGVPVAVVNPRQVRDFAKAVG